MNMTALREAIRCNLLSEYKELERHQDQSVFHTARYILFGALIDRLKFDPENGRSTRNDGTWDDVDERIREGCMLLCLDNSMLDPQVWSFIPRCLRADVMNAWNDTGDSSEPLGKLNMNQGVITLTRSEMVDFINDQLHQLDVDHRMTALEIIHDAAECGYITRGAYCRIVGTAFISPPILLGLFNFIAGNASMSVL
jgi:hypothetical protein